VTRTHNSIYYSHSVAACHLVNELLT